MILVVALLVLGPKRLPELARTVGKGLRELRRASGDLRSAIEEPLEEVRKPLEDIRSELVDTVHGFEQEVEREAAGDAEERPRDPDPGEGPLELEDRRRDVKQLYDAQHALKPQDRQSDTMPGETGEPLDRPSDTTDDAPTSTPGRPAQGTALPNAPGKPKKPD